MGITGMYSRLIGDLVQVLGVARRSSTPCLDPHESCGSGVLSMSQADDMMYRALTEVFNMESNGKIKKKKAQNVVEKLGLMYAGEELAEDEVPAEEVLRGMEEESDRQQLMYEAFKIFDEDGNGYIDAVELKRVLQCLGLDKGWDLNDVETMLKVADLNSDGKVDFSEFEVMMS